MLLAEQGPQKKERYCATNYLGQRAAHIYKLNLMIRMSRGVWCSLRFTMRRMDQWSKRTSSMCSLDFMSPRLRFRVSRRYWMHIECSCSNAIPYWTQSKRLFSLHFAVVLQVLPFAEARTLQNFWWDLSECRGQLRSWQLADLCEGTIIESWSNEKEA